MFGTKRWALLGLLLSGGLVACESTTEPAEPLTLEEAEALYFGMQALLADTTPEIISTTPDGGVFACPLGGQVTAAVDVRDEMAADTARLITNTTLDPDGCVLSSEGYEFTVDGNPNVMIALTLSIVETTFEFIIDGSTTGGVDWQLDDRSGTCMIDLTFSANPDLSGPEPTANGSTIGTMCGLEVEFDEEVGVSGT